MVINSTIVVPELEYWFYKFLLTAKLNKFQIPYPSTFTNSIYLGKMNSFIRLLFDDNWPIDQYDYNYWYLENTDKFSWPNIISDRLCIYPSAKYYEIDDTTSSSSENLFLLKDDDITMLNKLAKFRTNQEIEIENIDSTALTTILSNLVYTYLNLEVNEKYNNFDEWEMLSGESLLETCYEVYVTEKIFQFISDKGS